MTQEFIKCFSIVNQGRKAGGRAVKDEIFILQWYAGAKSCQDSSAEPGLLVGRCLCLFSGCGGDQSAGEGAWPLPCPQGDRSCGVPMAPAVVAAVLIPRPDQGTDSCVIPAPQGRADRASRGI